VADVVRLIVKDGLWVAGIGVLIGGVGAWWAGRFVEPLLFGVKARDPVVFAVVAVVLGGVALAASWVPAARAGGLDPTVALRAE